MVNVVLSYRHSIKLKNLIDCDQFSEWKQNAQLPIQKMSQCQILITIGRTSLLNFLTQSKVYIFKKNLTNIL